VPTDERATKHEERCDIHTGSSSVARCEVCDRPLCIRCALPVRGLVYGVECLPEDVGARPDTLPGRERLTPTTKVMGTALAVALTSTVLPWTRFGTGSGLFGAWSSSAPWSLLAAAASALGLAWWVARATRGRGVEGRAAWGFVLIGLVGAAASLLALAAPPTFTKASLAPWIGFACSLAVAVAALRTVRIRSRAGI